MTVEAEQPASTCYSIQQSHGKCFAGRPLTQNEPDKLLKVCNWEGWLRHQNQQEKTVARLARLHTADAIVKAARSICKQRGTESALAGLTS